MTSEPFVEWVPKLDCIFCDKAKNNVPSCPSSCFKYNQREACISSPNTTSMLQLMDQEVIGSLTAQNRRQIVQMYINERVLKP